MDELHKEIANRQNYLLYSLPSPATTCRGEFHHHVSSSPPAVEPLPSTTRHAFRPLERRHTPQSQVQQTQVQIPSPEGPSTSRATRERDERRRASKSRGERSQQLQIQVQTRGKSREKSKSQQPSEGDDEFLTRISPRKVGQPRTRRTTTSQHDESRVETTPPLPTILLPPTSFGRITSSPSQQQQSMVQNMKAARIPLRLSPGHIKRIIDEQKLSSREESGQIRTRPVSPSASPPASSSASSPASSPTIPPAATSETSSEVDDVEGSGEQSSEEEEIAGEIHICLERFHLITILFFPNRTPSPNSTSCRAYHSRRRSESTFLYQ